MIAIRPANRATTPARFGRKTFRARTCALVVMLVATIVVAGPDPVAHASFEPFAPNSPFRTAIPEGAALDPESEAMVARLSREDAMYANLVSYAVPIYYADPSTPRHSVSCTADWGRCPFDGYEVPIPDGAEPSPGTDAAMIVVDESTRQIFELWQVRRGGGQRTASWGGVSNLDGSGWGGGATGSGASRLGGIIQVEEIQQGYIPHALAVATDTVCANTFRPPATKTDGRSSRSDCIPEGARLRLDPSVDVDGLAVSPAARMVARAMQVYGAYVVDATHAVFNVTFEMANTDGIGDVYRQAGLTGDYDPLHGVPWDRLQVIV
jgi:hypothetical protein